MVIPQTASPAWLAPTEPSSISWETTNCPLCGSGDWSPVLTTERRAEIGRCLAVVQCSRCGLCFTNPRPDPVSIERFYPEAYGPHRCRRKKSGWIGRWPARFRLRRLERDGPAWHGQGRLLDLGCGSGVFLERMHRRGWTAVGLDVSAAAVDYVRDTLGLPALLGSLPHPCLPPASFDAATIWQTLEHVHRPLELLCAVRDVLAADGKLLLSVPNFGGAAAQWFGENWFGLDLPRHLVHFSPDSLRRMLGAAGFEVESLWVERRPAWVQASGRAARRTSGVRGLGCLAWRPLARLATWRGHLAGRSECVLAIARKP